MKKLNLILTLGAALLLAPLTSALAASTWQTVDNLADSRGRDIVADSAGNFISLALDNSTSSTGPVSTAVSRSSDHGATWQTVGSIAGYALDLTAAPDGALFATGNRSATVSGRAFLWQSLDHGATWTVSDPWAGQSTTFLALDVAAGNSGAIYVCGHISSGIRWLVRKGQRSAGGITWATVDDIPGNQANSICVRPAGVAGQPDEVLVSGGVSGLGTVRRSLNGGAAWATVDSYSTGVMGGYSGVATGPNNSIYVVGRIATTVTTQTVVKNKVVVSTTTEYGWLVRRSTNDGATWANVDYVANGWPSSSITVDAYGRIFAVGWMSATSETWVVRGSSDGGATWVTTDSFLPAGTTRAHGMAVASDAFGNVCVIGETGSTASTYTAPIRRLAVP